MPERRGLFEVAREKIRNRHLALRTEQAYLHWMRRYVRFHGRRHPSEMGMGEVETFLTHLAVEGKVAAATQNQALQAILFLYRQVLDTDLPWLQNVTRASRPKRLPVVLSAAEVRSLLAQLDGTCRLIANLLYGSGPRLMEAHRLRIKDLNFERCELVVRDAKGGRDRVTVLPATVVAPLREHLAKLSDRFERQRKLKDPGVWLPTAIARKYPGAAIQWGWQWVFSVRRPGIINIKKLSSGRSRRLFTRRGFCSRPVATPYGIALRLTSVRRAVTYVPGKNCSDTLT
jgi:integron integrase